jgi:hypothetical protein
MVRERTGEQLDSWLNKVEASHLQAFQPFVTGVQKDKEAVLAGLTLPWSKSRLFAWQTTSIVCSRLNHSPALQMKNP